jgi:hypothetical protein
MEANKHEWYAKLLVKLKRIEAGELQLADYIDEVEGKLAEVDDFLQGHYMRREPEKKSLSLDEMINPEPKEKMIALVGSGYTSKEMTRILLEQKGNENFPFQICNVDKEFHEGLQAEIIKKWNSLPIKADPITVDLLYYTGDPERMTSIRVMRRKKDKEIKKRMRK